jgi:peptidyl-tRNA hydrolase, PTH1 family
MRFLRRGERASSLDLLVAGLGNPGREHERDRHNVGWMVVDELARRHGATFRSKFKGQLAEVRIDGVKLALLKPETYMNVSGESIAPAARFFKVDPEDVLVIHDEVDFEHGRVQARLGGGLAGHKGLRSIAKLLGTPDFLRLRVGVGRPGRGDRRDVATTCSPRSSRSRTPRSSSPARPTPSRRSRARGSTRRSAASIRKRGTLSAGSQVQR